MLLSPWDLRPRPLTEAAYAASAPPRFGAELSAQGYYTDAKHSVVDPSRQKAYLDATATARREAEAIVAAADEFQRTGSRNAAHFALDGLTKAAEDGYLGGTMRGQQAEYIRGWLVGAMAIAYLKVRPSGLAAPKTQAVIGRWLAGVAASEEAFLGKAKNNHRYWGGLGVAAEGIACDRRDLFDWGVASARVGLAQIAPDGTLPLEMERGAKALHYHFFAAAPLSATAALAKPNGVDLLVDGALDRLVRASIAAYEDSSAFAHRTGEAQERDKASSLGWAILYARSRSLPLGPLENVAAEPYLYLGGLPPTP